jgi:hypothetical protein
MPAFGRAKNDTSYTGDVPEITTTIIEHPQAPRTYRRPPLQPVQPDTADTDPLTLTPFMARLRAVSFLLLAIVALAGIALSWAVLQSTSARMLGGTAGPLTGPISYLFPITVDTLIIGSSGAFIVGSSIGRPLAGWRLIAHVASGTSLFLNATAATTLAGVPWHMAPPLATILIVEISAKQLLGEHKAKVSTQRISLALWLTAPVESTRTTLRQLRQTGYADTRRDVGQAEAALQALRIALPGRKAKGTRKLIARQVRSGSATPEDVLRIADAVFHAKNSVSPSEVLMRVAGAAVLGIRPVDEAEPEHVEAEVAPEPEPVVEDAPVVEAPRPATAARYQGKAIAVRRPGTTKPIGVTAPSLDEALARAVELDVDVPGWYRAAQAELGGSGAWWRGRVAKLAREAKASAE